MFIDFNTHFRKLPLSADRWTGAPQLRPGPRSASGSAWRGSDPDATPDNEIPQAGAMRVMQMKINNRCKVNIFKATYLYIICCIIDCLCTAISWVSHVPRPCSGPGFDSRPGSLCCVSLSCPVSCHPLQLCYQWSHKVQKKSPTLPTMQLQALSNITGGHLSDYKPFSSGAL